MVYLSRYWKELGFDGECPIHFSEDELRSHLEDAEGWNEVGEFFQLIESFVTRQGWTRNERYDDARAFFSELRQEALDGLKICSGEGSSGAPFLLFTAASTTSVI
jgi:hypothetical protein